MADPSDQQPSTYLPDRQQADAIAKQRQQFEQAPGFITILGGPNHVFEFVNQSYARLFAGRDFVGRTAREAFPDLKGQGFFELLDRVYATGERYVASHQRIVYRGAEGGPEEHFLDFIYEPTTDLSGAVSGIFVEGYDVTEAHRAVEALREREARLRLVIEGAKDHAILTTDLLGTITSWSAGAEAVFGWSAEEAIGRNISITFTPEDRAAGVDVQELLTAARDGVAPDERWHVCKNGRHVFMNGSVHPLPPSAAGHSEGFIKIARDETQRRQTDEALRKLNADLERQVVERTQARGITWQVTPDLMGALNSQGYFETSNPAWKTLLGWSEAEVAEMPIWELLHPDDLERTREGFALTQVGQPAIKFPNRYRCKDGGYRWISWVGVPEEGMVYCTGRDITEERAAEAQLAQAQEALRQAQKMEAVGQLTGGIAHDFNNLLAGVSGSLELLKKRLDEGRFDRVDRYIEAAQTSTVRAAALTQRLLAFSRRQTLDPRPTDINRMVSGMETLVRQTVGPAVQIDILLAEGLWLTKLDTSQLENALLNLSINGRDAMPDGGRLTIETTNIRLDARAAKPLDLPSGEYACLCVSDIGTGMPPEVASRAFDPFFTTKPLGQGTGLGLSMIHGFARQSGGQVRILSEVGQGTTVRLYLPRFVGGLEPTQTDAGELEIAHGEGETVLVIDDEAAVRMLMVDVLRDAGYRVLEAEDGASALPILQGAERLDLLVTDVGLPGGLNGRQVADLARVSRPTLKVLFVTGYAEKAAVGSGLIEPGMGVVTKPFAMDDFAARVRAIIEN